MLIVQCVGPSLSNHLPSHMDTELDNLNFHFHFLSVSMDEDRDNLRQPWIALDSASETFNYQYAGLYDSVSFGLTRGYAFQVPMMLANHSNCGCSRGASSEIVTWFRPQAAGEPFPLLSQDGPNEWLQTILATGVLNSNEKGIIVAPPSCIDFGYITKITRQSVFDRLGLTQWPSGYVSGNHNRYVRHQWYYTDIHIYVQLELAFDRYIRYDLTDFIAGEDPRYQRDWQQPRIPSLYGNPENMAPADYSEQVLLTPYRYNLSPVPSHTYIGQSLYYYDVFDQNVPLGTHHPRNMVRHSHHLRAYIDNYMPLRRR